MKLASEIERDIRRNVKAIQALSNALVFRKGVVTVEEMQAIEDVTFEVLEKMIEAFDVIVKCRK